MLAAFRIPERAVYSSGYTVEILASRDPQWFDVNAHFSLSLLTATPLPDLRSTSSWQRNSWGRPGKQGDDITLQCAF